MARQSNVEVKDRREAVLSLLRREECSRVLLPRNRDCRDEHH